MVDEPIIKAASHRSTNDLIFTLITDRISPDSRILDFGAGLGHMCQRIGRHFENLNKDPREHLVACEVVPEIFQYRKIECHRIGVDSVIPFEDDRFDLIYAIEVLEHASRPYDFFTQAYSKLKKSGYLIFSVPNSLNLYSRFSFLLTGFADMFGPPSTLEKNAGRICGHIMPLNLSNFTYGLKKAGFVNIQFSRDRVKRSALILLLIFYPALRLGTILYDRKLRRYDKEVWHENRRVVHEINRLDVLTSRSCIMVARKPDIKQIG